VVIAMMAFAASQQMRSSEEEERIQPHSGGRRKPRRNASVWRRARSLTADGGCCPASASHGLCIPGGQTSVSAQPDPRHGVQPRNGLAWPVLYLPGRRNRTLDYCVRVLSHLRRIDASRNPTLLDVGGADDLGPSADLACDDLLKIRWRAARREMPCTELAIISRIAQRAVHLGIEPLDDLLGVLAVSANRPTDRLEIRIARLPPPSQVRELRVAHEAPAAIGRMHGLDVRQRRSGRSRELRVALHHRQDRRRSRRVGTCCIVMPPSDRTSAVTRCDWLAAPGVA